jgi:lipopolysaccharide transport protein LptA
MLLNLAQATPQATVIVLLALSGTLRAAQLPALDEQDTIVVTADQAWESDSAEVLNFQGNFTLNAPHYFVRSDTAELHGDVDDPALIIATGEPVEFWVEDDESQDRTYGEARRLEYDLENEVLRLTGKAIIRDAQTIMRSDTLEYNIKVRRLVSTGAGGVEIITQPD